MTKAEQAKFRGVSPEYARQPIATKPVLAVVLVILAVAGGTAAILIARHRRRTPPELRGDWWTPFEREFRAFARQQAASRDRERRRHRGERA